MSKLKKENGEKTKDKGGKDTPSAVATVGDQRADSFRDYNVSHLPMEARPLVDGNYKGKHSYTISFQNAAPQQQIDSQQLFHDFCKVCPGIETQPTTAALPLLPRRSKCCAKRRPTWSRKPLRGPPSPLRIKSRGANMEVQSMRGVKFFKEQVLTMMESRFFSKLHMT